MINDFRKQYYFLSNFFNANVYYDGMMYRNNEAAFQAAKIADRAERNAFTVICNGERLHFCEMDASNAKKAGRHVKLREDWEDIKTFVMYDIVLDKFMRNPGLRGSLLATGNEILEEGNTWGDRIWGTVNGEGENRLGKILMYVREKCRTMYC